MRTDNEGFDVADILFLTCNRDGYSQSAGTASNSGNGRLTQVASLLNLRDFLWGG